MRRCVLLAAWALIIAACSEAPQDPIEIVRHEIEVAPDDPAPRVALARLYLAQGRGDLAEVLIDQAVERGASATDLLPERAEALRLDGKTAKLFELPIPDSPAGRVRVLASRAKAQPSDAAYAAVFAALDRVDLPEIAAWLDAEAAAGRARAHHACLASSQSATFTWDRRPRDHGREATDVAARSSSVGAPALQVTTPAELQAAREPLPTVRRSRSPRATIAGRLRCGHRATSRCAALDEGAG